MRSLWVRREIDAPAAVVWELLVGTEHWPTWGPSVRGATVDGGDVALGATGTVTTVVGLRLPFEITQFDPPRCWGWRVLGVEATVHEVEELGPDRCRVGFGVPWWAAPYVIVCQIALRRLDELAGSDRDD